MSTVSVGSNEKYSEGWDSIFGKSQPKKKGAPAPAKGKRKESAPKKKAPAPKKKGKAEKATRKGPKRK